MNKYQKALDNLKTMGDKDLYNERNTEWCNILQELVDKETPKKPKEKTLIDPYDCDDNGVSFKNEILQCPNCENTLVDEYECIDYGGMSYCPNCGQRIDWSDE